MLELPRLAIVYTIISRPMGYQLSTAQYTYYSRLDKKVKLASDFCCFTCRFSIIFIKNKEKCKAKDPHEK